MKMCQLQRNTIAIPINTIHPYSYYLYQNVPINQNTTNDDRFFFLTGLLAGGVLGGIAGAAIGSNSNPYCCPPPQPYGMYAQPYGYPAPYGYPQAPYGFSQQQFQQPQQNYLHNMPQPTIPPASVQYSQNYFISQ